MAENVSIDIGIDLSRVRAELARLHGLSGDEARALARQLATDIRAAEAKAALVPQPTFLVGAEVRRNAGRANGVVGLIATITLELGEQASCPKEA